MSSLYLLFSKVTPLLSSLCVCRLFDALLYRTSNRLRSIPFAPLCQRKFSRVGQFVESHDSSLEPMLEVLQHFFKMFEYLFFLGRRITYNELLPPCVPIIRTSMYAISDLQSKLVYFYRLSSSRSPGNLHDNTWDYYSPGRTNPLKMLRGNMI